jgi:hypothetical protein
VLRTVARNSRAALVNPRIRGQATSRIWIGDLGVTHWAQDHDNGVDVPPGSMARNSRVGVVNPSGTRTIPSQATKTSESSGFCVAPTTKNSQGPLIGRTSSTTVHPLIHSKGTEQPQRRSKPTKPRRTGATPRCCDHEWRTAPRSSTRGGQNPRWTRAPASPARTNFHVDVEPRRPDPARGTRTDHLIIEVIPPAPSRHKPPR